MKYPVLVNSCSISHCIQMIGENLLERLEGLSLAPLKILEISHGTVQKNLNEIYPAAHFVSLAVKTAWSEKIPCEDKSLDIIFSNLALPWVSRIDILFQEFARVLKPEGTLLFSTFGPETLKEFYQAASIRVPYFTDMHDLGDLLLQVGLNHPVVDTEWFEYHCTEIQELLKQLKTYQAYPDELTKKGRLKALLVTYEQYRSLAGYLPVSVEVIYGYATGKP